MLEAKRRALDPTPPRPAHAELDLPIRLANGWTVAEYTKATGSGDDALDPCSSDVSLAEEEMAQDLWNLSIKDNPALQPTSKKLLIKSPAPSPSPEYDVANEWVLQWCSTLSPGYKLRAFKSQLRAYALWHEQGYCIPEVARFLRDPPLKSTTVAGYVLDAVKSENLPFEKARIPEVLNCLPEALRLKYTTFLKRNEIER